MYGLPELIFSSFADHTALSSFTTEASLLAGTKEMPRFPNGIFARNGGNPRRSFRIQASGILACTGTPTYLFTGRIGVTGLDTFLSGTAVGVSAQITCASGISNKRWEYCLDFTVRTPGLGASNCTLAGSGHVESPGGFTTAAKYTLTPGGGESATWTSTVDGSVDNYFNLSVTCSASSASNAIQCKDLLVWCWN